MTKRCFQSFDRLETGQRFLSAGLVWVKLPKRKITENGWVNASEVIEKDGKFYSGKEKLFDDANLLSTDPAEELLEFPDENT